MDTNKIKAEALEMIREAQHEEDLSDTRLEAIIQSAIDKATENIADFAAEVVEKAKDLQSQLNEARGAYKAEIKSHQRTFDLLKHSRAAHASEQDEHKMAIEFSEFVWFAALVEPYVANQYCHKKDDLSRKLYDACVKIRPFIDQYRANIPPAHASEPEEKTP